MQDDGESRERQVCLRIRNINKNINATRRCHHHDIIVSVLDITGDSGITGDSFGRIINRSYGRAKQNSVKIGTLAGVFAHCGAVLPKP